MSLKPKKISVRPGNTLEGGGFVVWIYSRKVQIQLQFNDSFAVHHGIREALDAYYAALSEVG